MSNRCEEITRFCTLTAPRSGSTWLMSLLNSHRQIGAFGEVFLNEVHELAWYHEALLLTGRFCQFRDSTRWMRPWSTFRYMETLVESFSEEHDALGFKLMYNQLLKQPEVLFKMMRDRYKIIHLVRENHLDVQISKLIARKRGVAHSNRGIDSPRVHLAPSLLVMRLSLRKRMIESARFSLRVLPLPVLEVTYDALCKNTEAILNKVAKFLTVPSYADYKSPFKKISSAKDWERIENYEEVKEALAGTEFQNLLDVK